MAVDLGLRLPPDWAGRPPHMAPADADLWFRWKPGRLAGASALYFDVALGTGAPSPEGTAPEMARAWSRLTALRADVVVEFPDRWSIVELRAHAGASALGALLSYLALWRESPPDQRPASGSIVTDFLNDDVVRSARGFQIPVVGLGPS